MERAQRVRRRREETAAAMLDAAEALFSERGFAAVSVRDIAARAGVSHALVHRYLGSKAQVYRAVLRRDDGFLLAAAAGSDDLFGAASLMLREGLERRRSYLRIAAHSALSGLPYESMIDRSPAARRIIELAERRAGADADPTAVRLAVASAFALFLGWAAAEAWLLPSTGLRGLDAETALAGLERALLAVLADGVGAALGEPLLAADPV